ncbi:MAG TPA: hypothetical protein VI756_26915, partial [Blastocatellia bacterium]
LILRRANVSRKGGEWKHEDYDVFDGERCIGRIYQANDYPGPRNLVPGRGLPAQVRSYGHAASLDEARLLEYRPWQR